MDKPPREMLTWETSSREKHRKQLGGSRLESNPSSAAYRTTVIAFSLPITQSVPDPGVGAVNLGQSGCNVLMLGVGSLHRLG